MKMSQLEAIIRKIVKETYRNEISEIINEKLEDFENEIADAINEAVDMKLDKKIKGVLSKKSLKEKIIERNEIPQDLNDDWSELIKEDSTKNSSLRNKLSTGIMEDYLRESTGRKSISTNNNQSLRTLPAPDLIDLNKVSGNPDDYSSTNEMIEELTNADYSDLL